MRPKTLLALCSLFLLALAILLYPSARIPAIHAQEGEKNQPEQQELAPPTNVVDHGLLSPEERKALMLSEGYSPESVEQYFELEAQLLRAASSPLPQQKLDQLTEKFEQDINALLRKDPPRINIESPEVETVISIDGIYASCADRATNEFGMRDTNYFKGEIIRYDGYAYIQTGSCSGACAYGHFAPAGSYSFGRASITGSSPYFTFHDAHCGW